MYKRQIANNADWLRTLNYIDFLRDVGALFSVNRMLAAECYKQRLERGLTFLEFNYMLMQSYDFLELNHRYGCTLQTLSLIHILRADGTLTALSEKYFGSDISGATSDAEETAEPAGETAEEAADATGEAVPAEETEPAGEAG